MPHSNAASCTLPILRCSSYVALVFCLPIFGPASFLLFLIEIRASGKTCQEIPGSSQRRWSSTCGCEGTRTNWFMACLEVHYLVTSVYNFALICTKTTPQHCFSQCFLLQQLLLVGGSCWRLHPHMSNQHHSQKEVLQANSQGS